VRFVALVILVGVVVVSVDAGASAAVASRTQPRVQLPTFVFPPDGGSWLPLRVPGSRSVRGAGGRLAEVVELRGWLRFVGARCSGDVPEPSEKLNLREPDWHYNLELDLLWLDHLGVKNPNTLIRAGNVVSFPLRTSRPGDTPGAETGALTGGSEWTLTSGLIVHVEASSWDPERHPGERPPTGWRTFTLPGCTHPVLWAYDPRNPVASQPPLSVGQYVRMVGSLVTDQPHVSPTDPGDDTPDRGFVEPKGQKIAEIRHYWQQGHAPDDPANPARWTELHPPDLISVMAPPGRTSAAQAVLATQPPDERTHGPALLSITISPTEPSPHPGATVHVIEALGPASRWAPATPRRLRGRGARITIGPSAATIEITLGGDPSVGNPTDFQAVYRLQWK
jgi:hypothetical protein